MALVRKNSVWTAFAVGVVIGGVAVAWLWKAPEPAYAAERISLADLLARIEALEAKQAVDDEKLANVDTMPNGDLVIEGVNLHIRSGSGATAGEVNGRGNLIVGYNENADGSGSHNVIVGRDHTYSSYGGIVAGMDNEISGPYASVTGGRENTASDFASSVTGGSANTASGFASSATGGSSNVASGDFSNVGGGIGNMASGFGSSVSGGATNTASGFDSSVSGGKLNEASGDFSSVSGGQVNEASGSVSSVSGGDDRTATGHFDWVAGSLFEDD